MTVNAVINHSAGRATQVPTGRVFAVRKRVRKIGYNGFFLSFERDGSSAR